MVTVEELEKRLHNAADTGERIDAMLRLARGIHRNNAAEATKLVDEAMNLVMETGKDALKARALCTRAWCLLHRDALKDAEADLDQAREFIEILNLRDRADLYYVYGILHIRSGHYLDGAADLTESIALRERIRPKESSLNARIALGTLYTWTDLQDKAMEILMEALEEADPEEEPLLRASALNALSIVHTRFGNDDEAVACLEEARALYQARGDTQGEVTLLMNRGVHHEERREFDRALEYSEQALKLGRDVSPESMIATLLTNIGTIHEHLKNYRKALRYEDEALSIAERLGNRALTASILRCRGRLFTAMGHHDRAEEALQQAAGIAGEHDDKDLLMQIHYSLAELFDAMDIPEKALLHYKQYMALGEMIQGPKIQKRVDMLRTGYQLKRLDAERELHRLKAERLEMEALNKERELTTMALQLARKHEVLMKLRTSLTEMEPGRTKRAQKEIAASIRIIEDELNSGNDWDHFERRLHGLRPEFTTKLSERFPGLTATEVRICSLLTLRLSSKDIADLLCISVHTVNTHRQRIRAKINPAPQSNLVTFLNTL